MRMYRPVPYTKFSMIGCQSFLRLCGSIINHITLSINLKRSRELTVVPAPRMNIRIWRIFWIVISLKPSIIVNRI
jgi:hypothetical protein